MVGSGGEAADDASIPAIHKSKHKNNHMLPNGDGRTPIRIPVPPVTRGGKNWSSSSRMNNDPESQQIKPQPEDGDGGATAAEGDRGEGGQMAIAKFLDCRHLALRA